LIAPTFFLSTSIPNFDRSFNVTVHSPVLRIKDKYGYEMSDRNFDQISLSLSWWWPLMLMLLKISLFVGSVQVPKQAKVHLPQAGAEAATEKSTGLLPSSGVETEAFNSFNACFNVETPALDVEPAVPW